jgi:hypothetical protein
MTGKIAAAPETGTSVVPPLYKDENEKMMAELSERFPADQIEWRIGRAGKTKEGKIWATALAYINNRAIMNRLDHVVGGARWRNEFKEWKVGETIGEQKADYGVLCGISIKIDGEWVTKWDGAENTQIESVKGGLSDSMKRSGVQWGIGRYLYDLEETWADCSAEKQAGWNRGYTKEVGTFFWKTPTMPAWANPEANKGVVDGLIAELGKCQKLTDYLPIKKKIEAVRDTLNDSDYRRLMDAARVVVTKHGGSNNVVPERQKS